MNLNPTLVTMARIVCVILTITVISMLVLGAAHFELGLLARVLIVCILTPSAVITAIKA